MGYAQNAEIDHSIDREQAESSLTVSTSQRDVPSDWFHDPTDPEARQRSLDEAATAFLAAHEAGLLTDAAPRLLSEGFAEPTFEPEKRGLTRGGTADDNVVALRPGPTDEEAEFNATLWDALAPFSDDEGGALAWQAEALCAQTDPEAFFPEKGGSTRDAKRVCAGCNVRQQCLDYALENDERFGIWGGLSERERRRIRREGRL